MKSFATKQDLIQGFVEFLKDKVQAPVELAEMSPVYTPHIYKGGWVIKDFGYSVERISQGCIAPWMAGDASAV